MICWDHEVAFPLAVEAWVSTTTARVVVTVEAAAEPGTGRSVRDRVLSLLWQLLPECASPEEAWRVTGARLDWSFRRWAVRSRVLLHRSIQMAQVRT